MDRMRDPAQSILLIGALCLVVAPMVFAQSPTPADIDRKVEALLAQMTLEEKVGQLNQYTSNFDVTGPAPTQEAQKQNYEQIRTGLVGSMLNVFGADATRAAQKLAVEGSRLKIPLIFGYDVIHGYR